MSDTTLINDVSINGNEGLTPSTLSDTLQDNTINALGVDASSRTIWVNGQPYGNAYVNIKDDNTLEAPIGAEIFNDFEHNVASGEYSHAHGYYTETTNTAEAAFGQYNKSTEGSTIFSIGDGDSDDSRHNIVEVTGNGTNINTNLVVDGATHFESKPTVTNGTIAEDPVVLGSELEATKEFLDDKIVIIPGDYPNSGVLRGEYQIGSNKYSNKAISQTSIAVGAGTTAGLKGWYYSKIEFGDNPVITLSERQPIASFGSLDGGAWSSGTPNISVGDKVSIVNDSKYDYCGEVKSISVNKVTLKSALPFSTLDIGTGIIPNNIDDWSIYIPDKPDAGIIDFGGGALSEGGYNTMATNICAHAEGLDTHAYGQYSHTEGRETKAGYAAHAEGRNTKASGEQSHSEGTDTQALGNNSHAEGKETKATNYSSHTEGYGSVAGDKTTPVVINDSPADGCYSHAEGNGTRASGHSSHSEGKGSTSSGNMSHAEGLSTEAAGNASHAEGNKTKTTASSSHAEGIATTASGTASHAEGQYTKAAGNASHAEGMGGSEDNPNLASGSYSHAEGQMTKATNTAAHAEGRGTTASASYSHAEGENTTASGVGSHTEGKNTRAEGRQSHAQGENSVASGNISFASGRDTVASTSMASALGDGTIANNISSTAFGSYNVSIAKTDNNTAADATFFSIGIGRKNTGDDAATNPDKYRKNAFEVKQNGDVYITGIGGYDGTNPSTSSDIATYLPNMVNITYEDLAALKTNSKLVPGQQYRITDYVTTTSQDDTDSANHAFDIIVTANSTSSFSEVARACLHESDDYFSVAGANLDAWKIWYCFDNDTNRFSWAVPSEDGGKGVIYRMIDEWNNDLPYDFKNIRFKRYKLNAPDEYPNEENGNEWITRFAENIRSMFLDEEVEHSAYLWAGISNEGKYWSNNSTVLHSSITGEVKFFYTFDSTANTDASLLSFCHDNTMMSSSELPNNVFFGRGFTKNTFGIDCKYNSFDIYCSYNTFGNGCSFNTFDEDCNNNHFGDDCSYNNFAYSSNLNSFGDNCYSNSFGVEFYGNTFGTDCYYNSFGNSCSYNSFANMCGRNTFGDSIVYNSFGNNCTKNIFGEGCNNNKFGNSCEYNIFRIECNYNEFGNNCGYNMFYNYCSSNKFGNSCGYFENDVYYGNTFYSYCSFNTFGNNCFSNTFKSENQTPCSYNTFGNGCDHNTFGKGCTSNKFDDYCSYNVFTSNCNKNSFGNNCTLNEFGNACDYNSFGNSCASNKFYNGCNNNSFGNYCGYYYYADSENLGNVFGNYCDSNSFGNYCYSNSFGNYCDSNSFGNNCYYNSFGNYCNSNSFGNECSYNSFRADNDINSPLLQYCRYNHFDDGCSYIILYNISDPTNADPLKNYNINRGVCGKVNAYIPIRGELNSTHDIQVTKISDESIIKYYVSDAGLQFTT